MNTIMGFLIASVITILSPLILLVGLIVLWAVYLITAYGEIETNLRILFAKQ